MNDRQIPGTQQLRVLYTIVSILHNLKWKNLEYMELWGSDVTETCLKLRVEEVLKVPSRYISSVRTVTPKGIIFVEHGWRKEGIRTNIW
jgi:hypothetical protein